MFPHFRQTQYFTLLFSLLRCLRKIGPRENISLFRCRHEFPICSQAGESFMKFLLILMCSCLFRAACELAHDAVLKSWNRPCRPWRMRNFNLRLGPLKSLLADYDFVWVCQRKKLYRYESTFFIASTYIHRFALDPPEIWVLKIKLFKWERQKKESGIMMS